MSRRHQAAPKVSEEFRIRESERLRQLREEEVDELVFPSDLSNEQRRYIHGQCQKLGLFSKSRGKGEKRYLTVTKQKGRAGPSNAEDIPAPLELVLPPVASATLQQYFSAHPVCESDIVGRSSEHQVSRKLSTKKFDQGQMNKEGARRAQQHASLQHKRQNHKDFIDRMNQRERLPAWEFRQLVADLSRNNQVCIVSGETGCGKSTQVPQFILDDPLVGPTSSIVCTQPRRIAAITLAQRIAHERCEQVGGQVGYSIRLESKKSASTQLLFCTTALLLRRFCSDPKLTEFTHVILDEVHERDKYSDFLMIILRDLLPQRPDLRIILMSATMQLQKFSNYFYSAPNITIGSSCFAVDEFFLEDVLPLTNFQGLAKKHNNSSSSAKSSGLCVGSEDAALYSCAMCGKCNFDSAEEFGLHVATCFGGEADDDQVVELVSTEKAEEVDEETNGEFCAADSVGIAVADTRLPPEQTENLLSEYLTGIDDDSVDVMLIESIIDHICNGTYGGGAILVFLPGWQDITQMIDMLKASSVYSNTAKYWILPLHSGIPAKEQQQVFKKPPSSVRKIILSTNIAETSITIDDVVFVVDSGKVKEKSYDPHLQLCTMQTTWVSLASMKQRKGRAGRVQRGCVFHLFSRTRTKTLRIHQDPELLRTPLEELALQVKVLVNTQGKGSIAQFLAKALQAPHVLSIASAIGALVRLGALTNDEELTQLGRYLADIPVDPHVGKMVLLGHLFGCYQPILTIACAMSYRDPFVLPMGSDAKRRAEQAKVRFAAGIQSDQTTILRAVSEWEKAKTRRGEIGFCNQNFASNSTFVMIQATSRQLASELRKFGFGDSNSNSASIAILLAVICASLYPNVVERRPGAKNYSTKENRKARFHVSSVLAHSPAAEVHEFMAFQEMTVSGTGGVYLMRGGSAVISPLVLLLLCGQSVSTEEGRGPRASEGWVRLTIDDWIEYEMPSELCSQIKVLRRRIQDTFVQFIKNPQQQLPPQQEAVVTTVSNILKATSVVKDAKGTQLVNTNTRTGGGGGGGRSGGRAGDWTCPKCKAKVFASKVACFRCNTRKPQ